MPKGRASVPSLIARSPLEGQEPVVLAGLTLSEAPIGRMVAVRPRRGQQKALARVLRAAKLAFPAPNRTSVAGGRALVWTAQDQAFLIGEPPEGLDEAALLADQSDGWARLVLEGPGADVALMRLVPLDLRPSGFAAGQAARAPLNHMPAVLMRPAADRFEILVFRSMARTAWHEIERVLRALAARRAAGV